MTTKPEFFFDCTPMERKIRILAQQDGLTPRKWFKREADKVLSLLLRERQDLAPKEVASELGLSPKIVKQMFRNNQFKGAYLVNSRVIRIPMKAVQEFKDNHRIEA